MAMQFGALEGLGTTGLGGGAAAGALGMVKSAGLGAIGLVGGLGYGFVSGIWQSGKGAYTGEVGNSMKRFSEAKGALAGIATVASQPGTTRAELIAAYDSALYEMAIAKAEIAWLCETDFKEWVSGGHDAMIEIETYENELKLNRRFIINKYIQQQVKQKYPGLPGQEEAQEPK